MEHITESDKKILLFLLSVPGIGNVTISRLLAYFGDFKGIYGADESEAAKVLNSRQLVEFRTLRKTFHPEREWETMIQKGIRMVTLWEDVYPARLKNIPDAPYGIFYLGGLPGTDRLSVSVIGARDCSGYGEYVAKELGKALANAGIDVVSGMARGIDGIAQRAALEEGGSSYAVLGNGVDICYPQTNRLIYEQLQERGGILSAYPLGTQPRPQNFPPRNRIVSGLSDAVVVVEARLQSGTLITVDMALEQGREVYVVPGRVTDRLSDGCNRLIQQGAGLLLSPESFIEELTEGFSGRQFREREGKSFCESRTEMSEAGNPILIQKKEKAKKAADRMDDKEGNTSVDRKDHEKEKAFADRRDDKEGNTSVDRKDHEKAFADKENDKTGILLTKIQQEVLCQMDFTPRSIGEISAGLRMEVHGREKSLIEKSGAEGGKACGDLSAVLMELTIKGLVVQVGPGYFALRGRDRLL